MTQAKTFQVTNMSKRLHHFAGFHISPGSVADIPVEYREAFDKAPFSQCKPPEMVAGDSRAKLPAPAMAQPLTKIPAAKAIEMVNVENDLAQLAAWAESETRKDVLAAIDARSKAL